VMMGLNPSVNTQRTDVEWVPEMPQHWRLVRVKDVMEFFNTVRVPLSAAERGVMTEKTYDYYGASGVIDKVEAYLFDGAYILIAEDGANLLTRSKPLAFLAAGKFWVNNHAHILKPRWGGDDTFFVTLLESQDFSLFVTGAAQPKLTMENLGRFKLAVPRVTEQKEIATFIREKDGEFRPLFAQIERQIAALTAYRKSLIHECVTGQRRVAAIEFARRRIKPEGLKITTPADVLPLIRHFADRKQEHFVCVTINGANEVLNIRVVSSGLLDRAPAHPREVFADALTDRASAIVLAHNHPEGGLEPSPADVDVTRQIKQAGEILGIHLLDHIIFNPTGYFSFLEAGKL